MVSNRVSMLAVSHKTTSVVLTTVIDSYATLIQRSVFLYLVVEWLTCDIVASASQQEVVLTLWLSTAASRLRISSTIDKDAFSVT